ncbi:MAG: VWA domain-containing protein [Spirochaetales bacterium]|nr:VWA domain-containing protein [Spirochaetales bacterium]
MEQQKVTKILLKPLVLGVMALGGLFLIRPLAAQDLTLTKADVRLQAFAEGYHVIIRAKPGVKSVLMAEAFELPSHKLATYNFRALEPNELNRNDKRLLNGKFLKEPNTFLTTSTLRDDPYFGKAFEILLPPVVEYGYEGVPGARFDKIDVRQELTKPGATFWLSLRTFALPYNDYRGAYRDNAFELKSIMVNQVLPVDTGRYVKGFEALFDRLGPTYKATSPADAVRYVQSLWHDNQDVVLCIDTTQSMKKDMQVFRAQLLKMLLPRVPYKNFRLGVVFYKDYMDPYLTETLPFQTSMQPVQDALDSHTTGGGGDIPEAAVEALYQGVTAFPWSQSDRLVVDLADAPQHDSPRGKITEEMLHHEVAARKIDLHLVMLPLQGD